MKSMKWTVPIVALPIVLAAVSIPAMALVPATPAKADGQDNADEIVCKKQTDTGTRFQKKTCRTRAQWDEIRDQNQRDLKEMVDRPKICGGGGSAEGC